MKKTVQIVTIPLDKKGFSINDLIKKPAFDAAGEIERWKISYYGMSTGIWKAHQLLVLSDDEIKEGDVKHSKNCEPFKKVIASYPQIEGTLAISKETVQAWIDSGTPGKGSLEMEEHPMNKATFAQNMYQLKLTPDNEVVIVDEPNIVEMTLKATTLSDDFVDQELQDAAKESVGEIEDMAGMAGYNGFIKGATWQKERSLKDFYDHGYIEARVNAEWTDTDMVDFLITYSDRHLNNCKDVLEMYKKLKSK